VGDCNSQWNTVENDARPDCQLERECREQNKPIRPEFRPLYHQPPEEAQDQRGQDGAESMREMNRDAGWIVQYAALVVYAQSSPHHESLAKIHDGRPPPRLARRKIRARQRSVVRARPAAQRNLQHQHERSSEGQRPQGGRGRTLARWIRRAPLAEPE